MCVGVCAHLSMSVSVSMSMSMSMSMSVSVSVSLFVSESMSMSVSISVCMHVAYLCILFPRAQAMLDALVGWWFGLVGQPYMDSRYLLGKVHSILTLISLFQIFSCPQFDIWL